MEKRTIRSGAPFLAAGLCVMAVALTAGISGSVGSYALALAAGALGFFAGRALFPDRVVEVERGPRSGSADVDALILEARGQLEAIERADAAIADPALSAAIADIVATCRQMLLRLEEQPGMLASMRTFLRYYLPATMKLLDARARLEGEVGAAQNAPILARVAGAVADVQAAFHKQLDALNEYRFINLESEMDALSAMLRADGLAGDAQDAQDAQPTQDASQADAEDDPFAGLFARGGR